MWANTCWGLVGLASASGLAVLGLSPEYLWLRPWLLGTAVVLGAASVVCFCWPKLQVVAGKALKWLSDWRLRVPWERRSLAKIRVVEVHRQPPTQLTPDHRAFRIELRAFALNCIPILWDRTGRVLAELKTKEAEKARGTPESIALISLFILRSIPTSTMSKIARRGTLKVRAMTLICREKS
jgi:hypothetical protein